MGGAAREHGDYGPPERTLIQKPAFFLAVLDVDAMGYGGQAVCPRHVPNSLSRWFDAKNVGADQARRRGEALLRFGKRAAAGLTLDLYQSDTRLPRKVLKAARISARATTAVAIVRPRVMTSRSMPRRVISGFVVSFGREQVVSIEKDQDTIKPAHRTLDRRRVLLGSSALAAASAIGAAAPRRRAASRKRSNRRLARQASDRILFSSWGMISAGSTSALITAASWRAEHRTWIGLPAKA